MYLFSFPVKDFSFYSRVNLPAHKMVASSEHITLGGTTQSAASIDQSSPKLSKAWATEELPDQYEFSML